MVEIYPWQQAQWQQIMSSVELKRLPHGLIFTGVKGVGKSDFASNLATKLIATNSPAHSQLMLANTHPDFMTIGLSEKSKVIKVSDFRQFLEQTKLTPKLATMKVAVIDHAELMTTATANNFLKTLEEPAGNTIFILLSHQQQPLLPTIISRCQTVIFNSPKPEQSLEWLAVGDNGLVALAMANNSPLLAKKFLDNELQHSFYKILQQINSANINNLFTTALEWSKHDFMILSWWQGLVTELLRQQLSNNYQLPVIYQEFKFMASASNLAKFYHKLIVAKLLLAGSINARLTFENLLITWSEIWHKN